MRLQGLRKSVRSFEAFGAALKGAAFALAIAWPTALLAAQGVAIVPPGAPPVPGLTPDQQKDCGQDCMYKRANENTLLQAQTLIEELKHFQANGGTGFIRAHQEFCSINGKNSDADCFQLYKSAQIRHLQNLRGNIAIHSDMAAKLNAYLDSPDAQIEFAAGGAGSTTPITPYAPTIGELGKASGGGTAEDAVTRREKYRKWAASIAKDPDAKDAAFSASQAVTSSRDPSVAYYKITPGKTNDQAVKAAMDYRADTVADYAILATPTDQAIDNGLVGLQKREEACNQASSDPADRLKCKTGKVREASYGETRQIIVDASLGKDSSKEANATTSSGARAPAAAPFISPYDQTLEEQAKAKGVATPKNFVLPNVDAIDEQIIDIESWQ